MKRNLKQIFNKYYQPIVLIALSIIFFLLYSYLSPVNTQSPKFLSPDETVNYYFIKSFAQNNKLTVSLAAPDNILDYGPRGVSRSINGEIAPGSFLGFILLFGWLVKFFSYPILPYLTPILGILGVLVFYCFCRLIFNKPVAFFATIILFPCPAYWYYINRGLFHNITFVVFLIIGLYFLTRLMIKARIFDFVLSGFFLSCAVVIRSSEILWLGPVILVSWLYWLIKKSKPQTKIQIIARSLLFLASVILPLSVLWHYQNIVWGHPLATGYEAITGNLTGQNNLALTPWLSAIFFARLNIKNIIYNFTHYFLFLSVFNALILVSLVWLIARFKTLTKTIKVYLVGYLWGFGVLLLYYGSWSLNDIYLPKITTLGDSHVRYWLPIFIFGLPLVVLAADKLKKIYSTKIFYLIVVCLSSIYLINSISQVFFNPYVGLQKVKQDSINYQETVSLAKKIIPAASYIITTREDKIFWPEFNIIKTIPETEAKMIALRDLLAKHEIYLCDSQFNDLTKFKALANQYSLSLKEKFIVNNNIFYQLEKL